MANARNFNRSFSGGEISPEMFGRIDADKYQSGAAKMLNMIVKPQGPAKNRPGFKYVAQTKFTNQSSRLLRFRYSVNDSVIVELGNNYIRFYKNGGVIPVGSVPVLKRDTCNITSTVANITLNGHQFTVGEQVSFNATVGNIIVGTIYYIKSIATNTFQISLTDGGVAIVPTASATPIVGKVYYLSDLVSSATYNYYAQGQVKSAVAPPVTAPPSSNSSWHYMPNGVYEVPSPYSASEIFDVTYSQSNDVMTLAHPNYGVRELRRYADDDWEIVGVTFDATCLPPTNPKIYGKKGARISINHIGDGDELGDNNTFVRTFTTPNISIGDKVSFSQTGAIRLDDEIYIIRQVGADYVRLDKFETGIYYQEKMTVKFLTADYLTGVSYPVVGGVYPTKALNLSNGAVIYFPASESGKLPAGLSVSTNYVVSDVTDTTCRLKTTAGAYVTFGTIIQSPAFFRVAGGFMQPLYETVGVDNTYKITALHEDTSESVVSSSVSIKNNIYSATSYNLITWDRVSNASKYRIYKQKTGIYGYVGGTDQIDVEYYDTATLTISSPTIVSIPGHELTDPSPITFEQLPGGNVLPTGIQANTTYFVKRIDEGVNAGGFYLLSDINGLPISVTAGATGTFRVRRKPFFVDDNIAPDMGITPPIRDANDLNSVDNYPRAVGHFEQRRCFGGTSNDPQSIWMSKSGTENDFSYSIPVKEDDRVKFEVAARELNTIRHIVPMQDLILLTDTAEWRATSANSDAITPSSISIRPQSYIGANNVQPELVNNNLVFCAARGGHVRELGYNWQAQGFVSGDLSLRATHLFDEYELTDMTYGKSPIPCLWFASTSGKLLGLTYVPEEQIAAWHQHETDGEFISCATIPEQEEDRLYVVVKRTTNGTSKYFVERMETIEVDPDIDNAFYVDCGITQSNVVPFTSVTGLSHLEGETVSVLADGVPYTLVVTGGTVTLPVSALKAHVGLPYVSDLQTLPVTLQVDGFGQGRNYNVNKAWVRVFQTAGVKVGPSADKLVAANPYVTTPQLQESTIQVLVTPSWQADGQVYIRQTEPLPMTVVGLTFEVSVGG